MSQTKVSNIESGKLTPTLVDVELILESLGAVGPVATEILVLARSANTEWQDDWGSLRRGLDKKQNELARLEALTSEFRFFLPTMITGLLATPDYVRASLSRNSGDMPKTVAKKLERQQILMDTSKVFTFLLTEQAGALATGVTLGDGYAARPSGVGVSPSECAARRDPPRDCRACGRDPTQRLHDLWPGDWSKSRRTRGL